MKSAAFCSVSKKFQQISEHVLLLYLNSSIFEVTLITNVLSKANGPMNVAINSFIYYSTYCNNKRFINLTTLKIDFHDKILVWHPRHCDVQKQNQRLYTFSNKYFTVNLLNWISFWFIIINNQNLLISVNTYFNKRNFVFGQNTLKLKKYCDLIKRL